MNFRNFKLHKSKQFIHIIKRLLVMKKLQKEFGFSFPLSHKIVRNLRIVKEHIGDLAVEGSVTFHPSVGRLTSLEDRYEVEIDFIKWNGTDIKPVLELTGLMDEVQEAAMRYCVSLVEENIRKAA